MYKFRDIPYICRQISIGTGIIEDMDGVYDEELALKLLLPMKLKDRWALKSEASPSALETTEGLMHL